MDPAPACPVAMPLSGSFPRCVRRDRPAVRAVDARRGVHLPAVLLHSQHHRRRQVPDLPPRGTRRTAVVSSESGHRRIAPADARHLPRHAMAALVRRFRPRRARSSQRAERGQQRGGLFRRQSGPRGRRRDAWRTGRCSRIPGDREAYGQNDCTPDGRWFVYIHVPRGSVWGQPCQGAAVAAYYFDTGEQRELCRIDSAVFHVTAYDNQRFIVTHPADHPGMLLTDLTSGTIVPLRDGDPGVRGHLIHCQVTQPRRGLRGARAHAAPACMTR